MSDAIKLTEKSAEVFNYVRENGKASIPEIAAAVQRAPRSVSANVTDLAKKGLVVRVKEAVEGEEGEVTFVQLTTDGVAFQA
jgi:predicted transcriptional regulator|nr:MAG TPA: multiple antibiotic resistance protein MarR/DNA family protein, HTH motif.67A [Caudoviricetes sp.]DAV40432.1 MAG TPA: multiple antibiotic resistance protein MarR/DNA family protein, HTH motif.67A [Caudoviricetes sp.]